MSDEIEIRPYEPSDRAGVRNVCFQTGFMGEPADWFWRDQESFCDIFCGYWTDKQPGSASVAVKDGEVIGYLLGCDDSRKVWKMEKIFTHHAFGRHLAFKPGTAGVFWKMLTDGIVDGARHRLPPPVYYDERWPAHLHIDLMPVCRGHGVGARLVHSWLERLREEKVPGCHLQTMAENTGAVAFFETMGFRSEGPLHGAPGFRTREGKRMNVQLMVQPL